MTRVGQMLFATAFFAALPASEALATSYAVIHDATRRGVPVFDVENFRTLTDSEGHPAVRSPANPAVDVTDVQGALVANARAWLTNWVRERWPDRVDCCFQILGAEFLYATNGRYENQQLGAWRNVGEPRVDQVASFSSFQSNCTSENREYEVGIEKELHHSVEFRVTNAISVGTEASIEGHIGPADVGFSVNVDFTHTDETTQASDDRTSFKQSYKAFIPKHRRAAIQATFLQQKLEAEWTADYVVPDGEVDITWQDPTGRFAPGGPYKQAVRLRELPLADRTFQVGGKLSGFGYSLNPSTGGFEDLSPISCGLANWP